jgi:hypothetical protein
VKPDYVAVGCSRLREPAVQTERMVNGYVQIPEGHMALVVERASSQEVARIETVKELGDTGVHGLMQDATLGTELN